MATVKQHETESMKLFKQRAIEKYGFPIGVEDNINILLESDIYKDPKDPSFNEFWRYIFADGNLHTEDHLRYLMTTRRDDEQRRKQPDYTQKGELDRSHDSYRPFMSHRYASHEESPEAREV